MTQAAAWLKDPMGRHEFRYWDGVQWTDHVSDQGQAGSDPYDASAVPPQPLEEAVDSHSDVPADMPHAVRAFIGNADKFDGYEELGPSGAFWSYVPTNRETPQELDREVIDFWSARGEGLGIEVSLRVVRMRQTAAGSQAFDARDFGGGLTVGSISGGAPPELEEEHVQPGESVAAALQRADPQDDPVWITLSWLHWGPSTPDDRPFRRVRCLRIVGGS